MGCNVNFIKITFNIKSYYDSSLSNLPTSEIILSIFKNSYCSGVVTSFSESGILPPNKHNFRI